MAQALTNNVEFVQDLYDRFQRGDLESLRDRFAPNIEWTEPDPLPEGGTHRGIDAVFENVFAIVQREYGDDFRLVTDNWIGAGEHVVAQGRYLGTAPKTGKGYEVPFCHVMRVRDNRLAHVWNYTDTATMLKALNG